MKKLFIGILIVLMASAPAIAADICGNLSSLAATVMRGGQAGVSMKIQMDVFNQDKFSLTKGLGRALIIEAYERPRYSTKKYQQREIENFRDKVYLRCVKTYNK